jgi:hypothetical protein
MLRFDPHIDYPLILREWHGQETPVAARENGGDLAW